MVAAAVAPSPLVMSLQEVCNLTNTNWRARATSTIRPAEKALPLGVGDYCAVLEPWCDIDTAARRFVTMLQPGGELHRHYLYQAEGPDLLPERMWKPPAAMPMEAVRTWLQVTQTYQKRIWYLEPWEIRGLGFEKQGSRTARRQMEQWWDETFEGAGFPYADNPAVRIVAFRTVTEGEAHGKA